MTEFWNECPIPPITMLNQLRDSVLAKSQKRMPKWRFRFAPDFVIQIQPKAPKPRNIHRLYEFECLAVQGDGLSREFFMASDKERRAKPYSHIGFGIRIDRNADPAQWILHPRSYGSPMGVPVYNAPKMALRERVLAAMTGGRFDQLTTQMLLYPHCLICGKFLSDPASMARWIGPECAGTSSLDTRKIFRLDDDRAAITT